MFENDGRKKMLEPDETPDGKPLVDPMVVCRATPGYLLVMLDILTQVSGKVHTQPDGGEG